MTKEKRQYIKRHYGPATVEEARKMARIKAVHAAPLWGMVPKQLSLMCLRGEVADAVKIGRDYYVTPAGMDAIFRSNTTPQHGRRVNRDDRRTKDHKEQATSEKYHGRGCRHGDAINGNSV